MVDSLKITIEAAKKRGDIPDHILLEGPAGAGKTTLVNILVEETGAELVEQIGGLVSSKDDVYLLIDYIRSKPNLVVFIDEIHRAKKKYIEVLYSVMQDFHFNGEPLNRFTLIGATTTRGMLMKPFADRFKHTYALSFYTDEEIAQIIKFIVPQMKKDIAMEIATRSQGIPRIAKNLLIEVMNTAYARHNRKIPIKKDVTETFIRLDVDKLGLTNVDRGILKYLHQHKKASERTLMSVFELAKDDLNFLHETYLLRHGLIEKTGRGRVITDTGIKHLDKGKVKEK